MINKGKRRTKVKKVDMKMVGLLQKWRDEMNSVLKDTKHSCTLRPRKDGGPCSFCSHYKDCLHFEWERDYIYKQEEVEQNSKVREKRQGKIEEKKEKFDAEGEIIYPCEPFDFCCPDRGKCHGGEDCPWHEE